MKKKIKEKMVPEATLRGTFCTYEDARQRNFNKILGNVVDFKLEKIATIEMGSWGSALKIIVDSGIKITTVQQEDGRTKILLNK